jgi:hypothetical protein
LLLLFFVVSSLVTNNKRRSSSQKEFNIYWTWTRYLGSSFLLRATSFYLYILKVFNHTHNNKKKECYLIIITLACDIRWWWRPSLSQQRPKNKIKPRTCFCFFLNFYFEPKTIGKGIFVFFLTRDKKGIEKTMNEHSLCWCYVRVMWRHRLLFMSHRRNLFFSFIDCAQSEREYKRDTFFLAISPSFSI